MIRLRLACAILGVLVPLSASSQVGNTFRVTGTATHVANATTKVAFRFSTGSAVSVSAARFLLGAHSGAGGDPNMDVQFFTDSSGVPGTAVGSAAAVSGAVQNSWQSASFGTAVSLSPAGTYHVVFSKNGAGRNPNVAVVTPEQAVEPRTGAADAQRKVLTWNGTVWSTVTGETPVFVLELSPTATDPWASSCGSVAPVMGNPYQASSDLSVTTSATQRFFVPALTPAAVAQTLAVHLSSVTGTVTYSLSDGTTTLLGTLTAGADIDGYTAYTANLSAGLVVQPGSQYALVIGGTFTWRRDASESGVANCDARARATWRGSRAYATSSAADAYWADHWFQIGTCTPTTYYRDADTDTYGDPANTIQGCPASTPAGYVTNNSDCNDAQSTVHPGATEVCDNFRNDCTGGAIDQGCDDDGDRYCDSAMQKAGGVTVTACADTPAASTTGDDCDDSDGNTHPNAGEVCDNKRNDCTGGTIDQGCDDDSDGYCDSAMSKPAGMTVTACANTPAARTSGDDCNDGAITINPGAAEACDGTDNNCNSRIDETFDADTDCFTTCGTLPTCVSASCATTYAGTYGVCTTGLLAARTDCNDNDAVVYPGATEGCDGKDNNCNSQIDEGNDPDGDCFTACGTNPRCMSSGCDTTYSGSYPACGPGTANSRVDCGPADNTAYPGASEGCDGKDNDCDSGIDEGNDADGDCFTPCGTVPACKSGPCAAAYASYGACVAGTQAGRVDCDDSDIAVHPSATDGCNGKDDNCDGRIDEGNDADGDCFTACGTNPACKSTQCATTWVGTYGACVAGTQVGRVDCNDSDVAIYPGASETCDGKDNNCSSQIDEGNDQDGDCFTACGTNPRCISSACDTTYSSTYSACATGMATSRVDCSLNDNAVYPGANETCDGKDNNCNLGLDEGNDADGDCFTPCGTNPSCMGTSCAASYTPVYGACGPGLVVARADCDDGERAVNPAAREVCDGADNNCRDGADALDPALAVGDCQLSMGVCVGSKHLAPECVAGAWQPCPNSRFGPDYETSESKCDGKDNDCNGLADGLDPNFANVSRPPCSKQQGVCAGTLEVDCTGGSWRPCRDADYRAQRPAYEPVERTCDSLDNDCNGVVDDRPSVNVALIAQGGCNDGDSCTADECVAGLCTHALVPNPGSVTCDDGDSLCTTIDTCTSLGACRGTYVANPSGATACCVLNTDVSRLVADRTSVPVAVVPPVSHLTLVALSRCGGTPTWSQYTPRSARIDCGGFGKLEFFPPPDDRSFGRDRYYHADISSRCPGVAHCRAVVNSNAPSGDFTIGPTDVTFTGVCASLALASDLVSPRHGETVTFTVAAENLSGEALRPYELRIQLPPGVRYVDGSANGGGGTVSGSTQGSTLTIADSEHPADGGQYTFAATVQPDAVGTLAFTVVARAQGFDVSETASLSLPVKYSYDLGGCACGTASPASFVGFAATLLVLGARRRRSARSEHP